MKYIIDRIDIAIVTCHDEKKNKIYFSKEKLPETVKEGDILEQIENQFFICSNETIQKRERINILFNKLKKE